MSSQPLADALVRAHRESHTIAAAPFESALQDAEQAYQVQDAVARAMGWFDRPVPQHWKSGGPSRSATLTHAGLPPQHVWSSPADARGTHFNWRLIEAEVALRLGRDVAPGDAAAFNPAAAHQWLDGMCVSMEIVDSRWENRAATALLKLADLQSHGALVLGAWKPFSPRDWSQQACTVQVGDAAPQSFQGTHSLGDPAWLLPIWLRHVTRHGATVPKGTVVTTGTWCGMLEAKAGDRVKAVFEGIGEAEVQL
ncbi:fumarylacetoacetate hydrolase family protein [Ramlibacter sp. USB13]|uniref:Fumarylacetoacetate hydrolase family protein n=1 Tax=Ramlibacter cellulosilyticus TaxID=2764187 RepID=A0A923MP93_9BURK|nr:fumarylacetoacetate hydrolase family protein [Ramlibacter cellulosilyticus]MBC5782738.1 fumarylacetoacetate hydrolase family protein [Ramlibacter cellulosilyticus]